MPQMGFVVATLLGALPALAGLYYVLRGFQGGFEERKLFIGFIVGLMLGIAGFIFHVFIDPVIFPPSPLGWMVYVPGFAVLENLMVFSVLNYKYYRQKPETPFYGVSLGMGLSATVSMALIYRLLVAYPDLSPEVGGLLAIAAVAGVGAIMLRAGTGAFIGVGSARGEPWPWLGRAILAQLPFATLYMLLFYSGHPDYPQFPIWWSVPVLAGMLAYSFWLVRYVMRGALQEALPGQVKRKLRRASRRRTAS